jgi:ELWxxDGT repeat protein
LTEANGTVFFAARDLQAVELWMSNGMESGTVVVKDTSTNTGVLDPLQPANVNGSLFFVGGALSAHSLYVESNGAATEVASDLRPHYLTNVNGTLFFAGGVLVGTGLWRSNGAPLGTSLVSNSFIIEGPLTNVNGTVFFGDDADKLWRSDGTSAGTAMVEDLNPSGAQTTPHNLTNGNGTLFFTPNNQTSGQELWKTNGTATGTSLVKDI